MFERSTDYAQQSDSETSRPTVVRSAVTSSAANSTVDSNTVVEQVLHREEHAALREALQRLRPLQREPIVPAYYAGMSTAEIAEQLNVNRATIKTRIRDGLRKLTADLQGNPGAAAP